MAGQRDPMRWHRLCGVVFACTLGAWAGLYAQPVAAWGYLGHRVIAELAEQRLDADTRARLAGFLAVDGKTSIHQLANWADDVREGDPYRWTVPLHYINFRRNQCVLDEARFCADGLCVSGAVRRYDAVLGDPQSTPAQRLEALGFLVHFVADAHQPLHAGWLEDKGGNTYQVRWKGKGSNLHRIWDYDLLQQRGLDQEEYTALLAARPSPDAGSLEPADWVVESCKTLVEEAVYPPRRTLSDAYMTRALDIAEQRMQLAASRLAALLERRFGGSAVPGQAEDAH